MAREIIQPVSVHSTAGVGYSHVAKAGDTVYIAGQIALYSDGNLMGTGDAEAQTQQAFANLQAILEELGGSLEDVVKLTTYLTDRSHLEAFRRVRNRFLTDPFPPNILLLVSGLAQPTTVRHHTTARSFWNHRRTASIIIRIAASGTNSPQLTTRQCIRECVEVKTRVPGKQLWRVLYGEL